MAVNWGSGDDEGGPNPQCSIPCVEWKSIPEIARETGIPKSSLYSIRKHGAYAHRIKRTRIMVSLNEKSPHKTLRGLPVACTTSLSRGVCQFNVDLHNLWTHE